ncbi:unnamed protein product [Schistosoma mattheei]|uniref:Uncharacterized protein n=1 Tax=Schistosoma mattheei TaxID=31246 RepID=A0AA85B8L2_9TREM|nr:unnamed protein product [Schistosoma mattheei]
MIYQFRFPLVIILRFLPGGLYSSGLKRTQSMAGGMLLTYVYLHALMCRRIPNACSQL